MLLARFSFILSLILSFTYLPAQMVLSGVFDAQPAASGAKGVELYVSGDIQDASNYEIGSANNGSGNIEGEFTFPQISLLEGTYVYLAADSAKFTEFFGFNADFITGAMNINGNDAIVLLENGNLVDVYGEPDVDGQGTIWEHTDGWGYRNNGTFSSTRFEPSDWTFSGVDALEGGANNAVAPIPFPLGTYLPDSRPRLTDDNYFMILNDSLFFNPLQNDAVSFDPMTTLEIVSGPFNSSFFLIGEPDWLYVPATDYCGLDSLYYEICNAEGCDTARVMIEIDCNEGLPLYRISQINGLNPEGEADSLDVICRLRGVVHSIDYRENGHSFFIQDAADAGIMAFTSFDTGQEIEIGQEVEIAGAIDQFNGQLQIFIDSIDLISEDNALFGPQIVMELDETTESIFIRMESVELDNPADWRGNGSSFNVSATLPSGYSFTIRIDDRTVFSDLSAPQGRFTLQGIGSQFDPESPLDEGYQILPRILEDISPYDTAVSYTAYDIVDLRETDFAGVLVHLGEKVVTSGVPVGVNYNTGGISWALMDEQGENGISVFSFSDDLGFMDDFNTSVYQISGTLDQFNGLAQIVPDDIQLEYEILIGLSPTVVTDLNESTESQWVQMENMRIVNLSDWTNGSGGSGFNVDFQDEQGERFTIRVDADVALFNEAYPFDENTPVRLTGIGGQFDRDAPYNSGYQLLAYELEMMSHIDDLQENEIHLYPTICQDQVFVRIPRNAEYQIVNAQGLTVRKGQLSKGLSVIDLVGLHRGSYFVQMQLDHGIVVKKILLHR